MSLRSQDAHLLLRLIIPIFFRLRADSVQYRSSAPSSVASDPAPAYLSRYDRIRWASKNAGPLEMEDDLPGNHVMTESHPPRLQVKNEH